MNGLHLFVSCLIPLFPERHLIPAITAVYCHPLEHVVSNVFPILIGPTLLGSHIVAHWIWVCVALFSTTCQHSGYDFPIIPRNQFHDYHHKM